MNTISLPRKPQHPSRHHQAAFTIVELLIVIVVIAILAAISVVAFVNISQRANDSAIASNEAQAKKKLEVYKVDHGSYPPDQATFDSITGQKPTDKFYTTYTSTAPHDSYALSTEGSTVASALAPPTDCPSGFIPVPGNASLGTNGFCVMKYEAKNAGGNVPVSQASGTPWTSISQTNAIAYSPNVAGCTGCHLITNAEWMTIATDIAGVSSNWSGGQIGNGYIYNGHNQEPPYAAVASSGDDSDGYYLMSNITPSPNGNNRRTLKLSNNEVIWDFAGNAWEWNSDTVAAGQQPGVPSQSSGQYKQWSDSSMNWKGLESAIKPSGSLSSYSSTQGIGQFFTNPSDSQERAYLRSGGRKNGSQTGIFTLTLDQLPSSVNSHIGFRVAR